MDKVKFLINMLLAFFIYPFNKHKFNGRDIWLIGGHSGDIYNDNSKFFYEYMLKEHNDVETYWVVNKDSKVFDKIPGKKLIRGSVENYLYYYNSKAIVFSHAPSADIAPYNFAVPVLNYFHKKTIKVFLNHGTISFKKRKPMNKNFKNIIDNLYKSYNIVTASSEFERNVMVNDWGMLDDSVYIIGNARYDNLPTNEVAQTRDILYTPTWRDWIKFSSGKFTDTDYFKNIMNFLNDDKLNKILDEKDINVKIYMHHLMHEFIDDIKENITGKRIVFLDKGVTLANEIRKSAANITDYSSVAIDFLYMNRPILFYQFDLDEYMEKVDSYIDLKSEMFGSLAYNNDEAVNKLIDIIENNFEVMDNQKNERNKFFRYNDNKNCKRIYDCVLSKIK
ncbi:TPA: CDP-glycerol glycerophosphotransferase family protein [Clostridioides difficile]|uniref:CDP-glycerol glycerophosphotransferase family protein n=1 Tax=Clostridioides difficile TaxID=1496 RepID=UPI00097FD964|nr:CDP-glycerol glycerophosphotransferase family protein [Clostridioides difficile]MCI4724301.1 CDP-glycerol glycerophosphotransferase family protein [Clostridioides difficile]MCI9906441.1 CDP-glycerol glycerophosphotransferase family protein [Clostridioides difficile]MCJ0152148.1 CDP-glycerol glycerophosphotransferase family protein [Clostridioides difficile]MCO8869573.1 CDP-glycerol glycerophosphotransferase family protein [Clostridioides difficile]MCO8999916.1 CDP-glycerol glycerophosphotra